MRPILFSIGDFNIYSYGLMYALSLICGLIWARRRAPRYGLDKEDTFDLGFFTIIVGVLGAKLLYLVTVADRLAEDIWGTLKNSLSSGFVVYGGIIAGVLFALLYCRIKKLSFLRYLDMAVAPIALGQAIGRIGCLLAGCCYGLPTDAWYGITFPEASIDAPAGIPLLPVQPLSSFLNFVNVAVLVLAIRRFKTPGRTGALYMINYGVGRFLIEFMRNDYRGTVGFLSTSQFISVGVVAIGVLLMIFAGKPRKGAPEAVTVSEEASGEAKADKQDEDAPAGEPSPADKPAEEPVS